MATWNFIWGILLLVSIFCGGVSTSREQQKRNGFRIRLEHVDSDKNMTKFERIQHGMKRSSHRLKRMYGMVLDIDASVLPGNGEFLMKLGMGTPSETYPAIMDTGSDLIWTQCKPCSQCFNQPTPVFEPKKSSSFSKLSCSSELCKALPQSSCSSNRCEYLYTYGDYSSTEGILATETFTFGEVSVPGIGFGCGEDNEGDGFNQGSGLVGLGRGPLSLVSQLKETKFSYCLTSIDDDKKRSTLMMGSLATLKGSTGSGIKTTPLLQNPSQPSFYYLSLQGISVGGNRLSVKKSTFEIQNDGSGGLIIDSGLELCFKLPTDSTQIDVPNLVFHFDGGADLELPPENYIISDSTLGIACLAMATSTGMSILGNVQQQNIFILYDLHNQTLSFLPTQCHQL
ncbi:aspartic proteinase nepenthesin-1 isoform X2 [Euphorbia lathyris]|uniref:aspartic proteinase nepenthesin-1 isoform X2 n=1 Tax=Euphorbia lathyris TaxID=212925 RepID=UPI003313A808